MNSSKPKITFDVKEELKNDKQFNEISNELARILFKSLDEGSLKDKINIVKVFLSDFHQKYLILKLGGHKLSLKEWINSVGINIRRNL